MNPAAGHTRLMYPVAITRLNSSPMRQKTLSTRSIATNTPPPRSAYNPHHNQRHSLRKPQGRPRLKKAIAKSYSPLFGREINPETEVTITTGANEGMLSAFMGFIEPGEEVIIFEPFFDQYDMRLRYQNEIAHCHNRYISNIEMAGGVIRYVPLQPPKNGGTEVSSAGDWTVDMAAVEKALSSKSKMMVLNTP